MLAPLVGIIITLFILSVYFSAKSEEYKSNVEQVIIFSEQMIKDLENELKNTFKLTIIEGYEIIQESKISIAKFVKTLNTMED